MWITSKCACQQSRHFRDVGVVDADHPCHLCSLHQSYVEHFKLNSGTGWDGQKGRFRMNTRVVKIDKHPEGGHIVTLQKKKPSISRADSGVDLPSSDTQEEEPSSG
jgi:hypothetical protein